MNKIVYIRYLPLTEKVKKDFLMVELSKAGYEIEYWDITTLFRFKPSNVEDYIPLEDENIKIRKIHSKKELKETISSNSNALFVSIMTLEGKLIFLFHLFKIFNCRVSVFSYWPLPLYEGKDIRKIGSVLFNFRRLYNAVLNKLFLPVALYTGYIKTYDYCFKAGSFGWKGIGSISKKYLNNIRYYDINSWDYDLFVSSNYVIRQEPFVVFLDEYYPFHPDAIMLNGYSVSPSQYYKDINSVFSFIEQKFGFPVVIAAHPKALKYNEEDFFEGRKVIFDSTLELVTRASLVLAHDSLSIAYAIMCKKKLVFINSNEIKTKLYDNYREINHLAAYFCSPIVYADNLDTDNTPLTIDISEESKKVYDYIKEGYMSSLDTNEKNINLINKYLNCIFCDKV